ncbi:glycosyltransferase family 58 protein [Peniophora sp. CONT]|nr:glycosyltransferase family 58 protein [Peniophora sp. CONT]
MPSLLSSTATFVRRLLTDTEYFWVLATLVIVGDAVLTQLIIRFVPYTEIDWSTYMYQVQLYIKGERDYSQISGPTGPLVYPAGHVFIHQVLHDVTDEGSDLALAQQIYAALYMLSLSLTCAIYRKAGGVPNWVLLLLPLSKRLHSIFVLRMFNDCWAVIGAQLAILAYANDLETLGTTLLSMAISVKMSVLLYLPGLLVILVKGYGISSTIRNVFMMVALQMLLGRRFLTEFPREYLNGAFDLSRVFLYKWTVNWRFLDEQTFLSPTFARALLIGHATALVVFGFRWSQRDGGVALLLRRALTYPKEACSYLTITPDEVITILFTSNLIGILFSRSLHYQFYSWYAHQLPLLAWRTRYPTPFKLVLLAAVEYCWNVYPSTTLSSGILWASNALLLAGVWLGHA